MLTELYAQHREEAVRVDLDALFESLGVVADGRGVRLVDSAAQSALRRAITQRRSG